MRTAAVLTLGATLLAACSTTWDIDRYEAPEADFPTRHRYAWKAGQFSTPVEQPAANVAEIDRAVRAAVEQELARKGYVLASDPRTADMVVSFQISGYKNSNPREMNILLAFTVDGK